MIQTKIKKPVKAGIITGAAVLLAAAIGLLLFFLLKRPDPRALLKRAPDAATENLCLMALLERDPADAESWTRLLENYCALGADPLTLQAAQKGQAATLSLDLPPETTYYIRIWADKGDTIEYTLNIQAPDNPASQR